MRGFFREALSLASWVLALWLALEFGQVFVPVFSEILPSPALQIWAARLMTFVLVVVAGAVVNRLIGMAVRKTGLSGTDRVLGMGFGLQVADQIRDYVGEGIDYIGEEIQLGTSGED